MNNKLNSRHEIKLDPKDHILTNQHSMITSFAWKPFCICLVKEQVHFQQQSEFALLNVSKCISI